MADSEINVPTSNGENSRASNLTLVQPDVEKLGRQRPACFSSKWAEYGFCFSILMSVLVTDYFIAGFHTILPDLSVTLSIPPAARTWPSSALSLVAGAFLLPLGRLADIYGRHTVFNAGFAWLILWSLAAGFSPDYRFLILARAMSGLGAAAVLPGGIAILGAVYRPGPRKNLVFSLYGSVALLGFFVGILSAGAAAQTVGWRWYFWLGATVAAAGCAVSVYAVPRDSLHAKGGAKMLRMDWLGVATTVPGLILVVFAFTQSSAAVNGWASSEIYGTFVTGVLFLAAAVYVEGWVADSPLLPLELFHARHIVRMMAGLFVMWGVWAIYLFYSNFFIELVLGISPLLTALWYAPWAIGGVFLAVTSGLLMHLIPGRVLLVIAGLSKIVAVLLFALMPTTTNGEDVDTTYTYWAWVFPAMLAETLCVDTLYTVSNVFITGSLPAHLQGFAGALINCEVFLGSCFFLGVADLAVGRAEAREVGQGQGYKVAFWVGVVAAAAGVALLASVDIGLAGSDLTVEEKAVIVTEAEGSVEQADIGLNRGGAGIRGKV